jgi:hypothetical protein
MASLMRELKDDRAVLMMYVADELPAEDRVAVEQRLAGDARLCGELEQLRQLQQTVFGQFDETEHRLSPSDEAAIRRVVREMRRYQIEQANRPAPAPIARFHGPPRWSYPLLAAAASILLAIGLWGFGAFDGFMPPPGIAPPGMASAEQPTSSSIAKAMEDSFNIGRGTAALDEASAHAHALADEDESDPLLLMM